MRWAKPKLVAGGPEISVVVAVRDGEPHLAGSLHSVLGQDAVDLEVIVVDDGSSDKTREILAALVRTEPRLSVLTQPAAGLTAALIRGCEAARGDFIARQDVGDVSLAGRLARQAGRLRGDPALAFVSTWCRALGPRGELLWEEAPTDAPGKTWQRLYEQRQGPPHHGSVMMRRDAYEKVGGYRSQFRVAQDYDLWLRLAQEGKLGIEEDFLYEFGIDEGGLSARFRTFQNEFAALARSSHDARAAGRSDRTVLERAELLSERLSRGAGGRALMTGSYLIGRCLLKKRDARAVAYLRRAVIARPTSARAWCSYLLGLVLLHGRPALHNGDGPRRS